MATPHLHDSTLVIDDINADRTVQAAPAIELKEAVLTPRSDSMRLDMNEILGLKRN